MFKQPPASALLPIAALHKKGDLAERAKRRPRPFVASNGCDSLPFEAAVCCNAVPSAAGQKRQLTIPTLRGSSGTIGERGEKSRWLDLP